MVFMEVENVEELVLIMCQTPLQAVIAEKIVKENKNKKFYPVYATFNWNRKHEHYAKRLIDLCKCGIKRELINKAEIIKLAKEIDLTRFKGIYLASIDAPLNLILLSKKEDLDIYTYDDGTANITPKSFYFTASQSSQIFLGTILPWNKERVRATSKKHYTIFDSKFNIVSSEKLIKLDLFDFDSYSKIKKTNKEISILLGQSIIKEPIHNELLMQKTMTENNIDLYFPHPREKFLKYLSDKTIVTDLIIEEYIVKLLEDYDMVHIYHFYSTAAINLRKHPRVEEHIVNKKIYDFWELDNI